MRVPESWLRSFVDPGWSTEELAHRLTMAGLEVESAEPFAPAFDGVVVAEVHAVEPHPDADKLRVCAVDAGTGALRRIVCGAPNVAVGMRVPCALPGATLPGGLVIKPVTMRGVASDGMLCSARELGLSDDHSGLMVLPADAPVGRSLREALALDDTIFELKLTPNLAHCMSIVGVAREVAALAGIRLPARPVEPVPVTIDDHLPVSIAAPDLCGRFSGRVIRGVDARAPTPAWMRDRLERAGQRSISALVDISNYVLLELGRPTHVFDLGKVSGGLEVRWGRDGETLELLNGQTITLDASVGVIADARGLVSLAGIMGGESTAVSLETTDVYVEAAFWWPKAIAGRSRRYKFATDAGQRFERGVDPATTVEHIEFLSGLLLSICGGRAGPVDDRITAIPTPQPVRMRAGRARKVIGAPVSDDEMGKAFDRLGLAWERDGDTFVVTPPSYRFDMQIEEDLIEEVVRLWGYERLPVRAPRAPVAMRPVPEGRRTNAQLKRLVAARDYHEVINYSFVAGTLDAALGGDAPVRLLNPIAAQMDTMHTTLWAGLLENLRYNLNRQADRVRLFEVGRVYRRDPSAAAGPLAVAGIAQPWRLGLLAHGPALDAQWGDSGRIVDFFDVAGDLQAMLGPQARCERATHPALHPGRSARVIDRGRPIGWVGALHPKLVRELDLPAAPVLAEIDLDALRALDVPSVAGISKFPPVLRDIALVLPETVEAGEVIAAIRDAAVRTAGGVPVTNVKLFDEYRGKGLENKEKSLAFRLWMQDTERTLHDAEVASTVAAIVEAIGARFGGRLR